MNVNQIIGERFITLHIDGKQLTILSDHPNFQKVKNALINKDYDGAMSLMEIANTIVNKSGGKCQVIGGEVFYNNNPLHNYAVSRLLELLREGFEIDPILNFLNRLMDNPSYHVRESLYRFLEKENLPLTPDGCFLAYKSVKNDSFMDWYSNTIEYKVGSTVKMDRKDIDDNPARGCSAGIHAGSLEYVKTYHGEGQVVIVKIDPMNVVSVPSEDARKLRTCELLVVGTYDHPLVGPLTNNVGETLKPEDLYNKHEDEDDNCDCSECGCFCSDQDYCHECGAYIQY